MDMATKNSLNSNDLAICLVSGGLDSLVTAAIAKQSHKNIALLHLNYGQKTEKKELESFTKIANYYNVPESHRLVTDISYLKKIGGSSLTDDSMSVDSYDKNNKEMPTSYVPFRNTHILAIAVSWAEVIGASKIYIGAVYEDSSGYPDCRPSYYQAFNALIKQGTQHGNIEVVTPIIHLLKSQIVQKGMELKAPLELTWSCYQASEKACGICDSCALRLRGFQNAGVADPIAYKEIPDYRTK